jgi:hypothetical protein
MTAFSLRRFFGIAPRIPARALAEGIAQEARNADLSVSMELKPLNGNRFIQTLTFLAAGVKRLYLYDSQHWFEFADADTDVVRGPLPEDATRRTYITDSDFPKVTRNDLAISSSSRMPAVTYRLGVPPPATAPTTEIVAVGDVDNQTFTAYVYTFVTSWGEEGPPSPPSAQLSIGDGATVNVSLGQPPTGEYSWNLTRIYRLNTGSGGSDYQFLDEVPAGTALYVDTRGNDELAEIIPSGSWGPPPDGDYPTGPLRGLLALPNGSLCGFTGPTFCLSVPYLPHAWPFDTRYPIDRDILAIGRVPYGVVILTDSTPYLASGTDPSSISISPLPKTQACLSKRSVVDMGGYLLYSGPEGLTAVDGSTVNVVTAAMFEESDWRDRFNPASITGCYWEGRYVGFYDNGVTQGGFIYNPSDEQAAFSLLDLHATAGYYDPETDQLYLNVGGDLVIFSHPDETPIQMTWHSRVDRSPYPEPKAACRVVGEGSVRLEVFADGETVLDLPLLISGADTARLPGGYRAKEWSVRVSGTGTVEMIDLVSSVWELVP